jgi:hypothetical protein
MEVIHHSDPLLLLVAVEERVVYRADHVHPEQAVVLEEAGQF